MISPGRYFRNSRPGHKEGGEVRVLWCESAARRLVNPGKRVLAKWLTKKKQNPLGVTITIYMEETWIIVKLLQLPTRRVE